MSVRQGDTFQHALDDARRKDHASNDEDLAPIQRPRVGVGVPLGPPPGSGGKGRFGLALDWTDEPTDRAAPSQQPLRREAAERSSDTPAEIAIDLGLFAPQTLDQLTARWRDFLWRNHPDRQPLDARERANARVAIANTLYDRARQDFAKGR